jgi:hypothetical protein
MYGLKEAGKLLVSNTRLVNLLSSFDFHETSNPCLFRHVSRPILFVLVVDEFGVKFHNRVDFDYLACLLLDYPIPRHLVKAHPTPQVQSFWVSLFSTTDERPARTISVSYICASRLD